MADADEKCGLKNADEEKNADNKKVREKKTRNADGRKRKKKQTNN